MENHSENEEIEELLSENERLSVELTKNQIVIITSSMQSEIEEYEKVLENYNVLSESQKTIPKKKIKEMIRDRKIIIENLTGTHYPVFQMKFGKD